MTRTQDRAPHILDRRGARWAALGVFAALCGVLAYIHRDDFLPSETAAPAAGTSPYRQCLAERYAAVDQMIADGLVGDDEAKLFKSRAEAFCRDRFPD